MSRIIRRIECTKPRSAALQASRSVAAKAVSPGRRTFLGGCAAALCGLHGGSARSGAYAPLPAAPVALVLFLDEDSLSTVSGPNRYMMVLKPTATYADLFAIVDELNNTKLPAGLSAPRFSGGSSSEIEIAGVAGPRAAGMHRDEVWFT